MSEYKIIDAMQISREKWWDFTDNNENCNIFSTPYMYDVWNATPGYKSFAFFAIDENEEIKGLLAGHLETVSKGLLSKLSTRAVLMQSPVALHDEALSSLLKYYLTFIKRKAVYTEIRNNYDISAQKKIYDDLGFYYEDHLNILIDLSLPEALLWNNIKKNKRKLINKIITNDVIEVRELNLNELLDAYNILKVIYKRLKLPLIPYIFLENAIRFSNKGNKMVAYGIFLEKEMIGTKITLKYKNTVIGLYSRSREEYYRFRPNDILNWEVFLACKKEGYELFDFGGAGKPNVPYGVRDYKMSFGGKIVNFGRYYFYHSKPLFKIAETGFKSLQKINSIKSRIQNFNHKNS